MKKIIKAMARKVGVEIYRVQRPEMTCISLKPHGNSRGNVLLSYTINPFLREAGQPFDSRHHCDWECHQIAETFLNEGYCVDVINYNDGAFIPTKEYAFFLDCQQNLERLTPLLNHSCIKILHIIWAHWLFHNTAAHQRCLAIQERRGTTLKPQKMLQSNLSIERADYGITTGNNFTINTYAYARKPIYRTHVAPNDLYPSPEGKDFEACRKHFLWLGGGGLVHKGLDLVLEAFAEMPDHHLTVCGPMETDEAFRKLYHKELYQTPNIHTLGWVDVRSPEFIELIKTCIGIVCPSCAEGGCGAVVTCLHAGLIPIVSCETSVDVNDDFGLVLKNCTIAEIKEAAQKVSSLATKELELMARKAWEFARANHTREIFAEEYRRIVSAIINAHGNNESIGEFAAFGLSHQISSPYGNVSVHK
jgi:glycosyltransferase involved in cell wall biosynthesis